MRKSLGKPTFESILQDISPVSLRIVRAKKKKNNKIKERKRKLKKYHRLEEIWKT